MQDTERSDEPSTPPQPPPSGSSGPAASSSAGEERPALYSVGVILIAGKAALWLCLLCFGWAALALGIGIGMSQAHGDDEFFGLGLGGVLGSMLLAGLALFQLVVLALAIKAWNGRRPWVYALLALAVLNIASGNPIGIAVGVVALIGCVQVIDRTRTT